LGSNISRKLIAIIELIKKHGFIPSINELGRVAEKENICTRKTVFVLLPQIKVHESINFETVDGHDTIKHVTVSEKNYSVNSELDAIDKIINTSKKGLDALKTASHVGIEKVIATRDMDVEEASWRFSMMGVNLIRETMKAQQRLIYLESLGLNRGSMKDRFEKLKLVLMKQNLVIQKTLVNLDESIAANVHSEIEYELQPQSKYKRDFFRK